MTDSTIRFLSKSFAVVLTLALVGCASSKVGTKDLFHVSMIKSREVELTTPDKRKEGFRWKENEVSRRRMTPEELMEMLRDGKEKGYITGDFPVEGVEADRLAKTLYQQQLDAETAQSRLGKEETVVGRLTSY